MSVFKACDIRGTYPDELDEGLFAQLGRAVGTVLRERADAPSVLVAGDVRRSTPVLRAALIDGLAAAGCCVADLGLVPTPVAYFAARRLRPDGLAIVTASHNPAADNGLKLCLGPLPITVAEMAHVEATLASGQFATGRGSVAPLAVEDDYLAWLAAEAAPGDGLKFVLDCGNGGYSALAPRLLRRLGYNVVELFCTPDGAFPNRAPNPSVPGNLGALREAVPAAGAAFGAALDGDGDRMAIVDDTGRPLTGDQAIILLARHVCSAAFCPVRSAAFRPYEGEEGKIRPEGRTTNREIRPGGRTTNKVVCDIKCSKAVLDAVAACGATPLLERSGHTFIKTRMIREQARFGGEFSGHFFYRELDGGDDGLYSVVRLAELVQGAAQPVSAAVEAFPRYATTPDIRLRYDAPDGPQRLDQIAAAAEAASPAEAGFGAREARGEVTRLDGVRVEYPDGWGLARCSVTEPLLTLRFEAYEGSPRRIAERFLAPVPDLRDSVLEKLDILEGTP